MFYFFTARRRRGRNLALRPFGGGGSGGSRCRGSRRSRGGNGAVWLVIRVHGTYNLGQSRSHVFEFLSLSLGSYVMLTVLQRIHCTFDGKDKIGIWIFLGFETDFHQLIQSFLVRWTPGRHSLDFDRHGAVSTPLCTSTKHGEKQ